VTRIIAIDPGTHQSAWIMFEPNPFILLNVDIADNYEIEGMLRVVRADHLVIEMVASFGKPVGAEVFETCVWIGRFIGAVTCAHTLITRPQIKKHLCHSFFKVTDGAIRQRVIDLFGGKEKAIGKKKSPGPLYGIKGDEWQAVALGLVWYSMQNGVEAVA
jgi:hypothetical protein